MGCQSSKSSPKKQLKYQFNNKPEDQQDNQSQLNQTRCKTQSYASGKQPIYPLFRRQDSYQNNTRPQNKSVPYQRKQNVRCLTLNPMNYVPKQYCQNQYQPGNPVQYQPQQFNQQNPNLLSPNQNFNNNALLHPNKQEDKDSKNKNKNDFTRRMSKSISFSLLKINESQQIQDKPKSKCDQFIKAPKRLQNQQNPQQQQQPWKPFNPQNRQNFRQFNQYQQYQYQQQQQQQYQQQQPQQFQNINQNNNQFQSGNFDYPEQSKKISY